MTNYAHFDNTQPCGGDGLAVGAAGSEVEVADSSGNLKQAGTAIAATGTELSQFTIEGVIRDISTAGSTFVVSPYAGTITTAYTVFEGNITTDANAVITFEIGGVAVSSATATIGGASAQCLAGAVDIATPTGTNTVAAGGAIEIITDGGSTCATAGGTTTNPGSVTFVMTHT